LLTAYLLGADAAANSLTVARFVDSSPGRQGQRMAGVGIEHPRWLAEHATEYDAILLSSEGTQEEALKRTIRLLGVPSDKPIHSWKELVAA
jgi:hypothetical protein